MTEAEWLTTDMPSPMLRGYPGRCDGRKVRLIACACLRAHRSFQIDALTRQYVEVAEKVLDGCADEQEWWALWKAVRRSASACTSVEEPDYQRYDLLGSFTPYTFTGNVSDLFTRECPLPRAGRLARSVKRTQCAWLRCVLGNPFRPVSFSSEWRTDTALALARTMYERRDFSAMPILADALQDAECDNPDILEHCHSPGPHVRGCWVVDLVLGKE
jgi:hypothetical protein